MTGERRQHARIAFHAPARLVLGEHTLDVVVLDLSLKGAMIRLPACKGGKRASQQLS